jgi:hypothetical protein
MIVRQIVITTGALLSAIVLYGSSAQALSMKECSAKYKAAKEAGTLGGMKWNDFRKAQCGTEAAAEPEPSASPSAPATPPPRATATKHAVFPRAVSSGCLNMTARGHARGRGRLTARR